jgi:hypothetical protein
MKLKHAILMLILFWTVWMISKIIAYLIFLLIIYILFKRKRW